MNRIRYSKAGGRTYMHYPGLGAFATPADVQGRLDALSDDQLLEEIHAAPFVDPFVLGEIMTRGIYHRVAQPADPHRKTLEDMIEDMDAGEPGQ